MTIQKVSIGTISNIRSSDVTEIGIKSKVFRRINGFPNVNAMVSRDEQVRYEQRGGGIGLGSMTKFVDRLSFFKLEGKPQSQNNYQDLIGEILCIRGTSPIELYNTFQVNTGGVLYDFRFVPLNGNFVLRNFNSALQVSHNGKMQMKENTGKKVFFNADRINLPGISGFTDVERGFAGNPTTNNPEWVRGGLGTTVGGGGVVGTGGPVTSFNRFDNGVNKPSATENFVAFFDSSDVNKSPNQSGSLANSYFNTDNGVVAILNQGETLWEWTFLYGGSEIPLAISFDTLPGVYPIGKFSEPVTGTDGTRRKFALASSTPPDSSRPNLFALIKQVDQGINLNETTSIVSAQNIGNTSGTGLKVSLTKIVPSSGSTYYSWQISESGDGYFTGDKVRILDGGGIVAEIELVAVERDGIDDGTSGGVDANDAYWKLVSLNPNNVIADYYLYDSEDSSHSSGAEHQIVFMNEIRETSSINYPHLAIAGLRINSTKEINSFSQLSALIRKGIKVKRLISNSGTFIEHEGGSATFDSTNNFVEIAHDLLTNEQYGAAELIGIRGVNRGEMQQAAFYCLRNGFTWDGVIDRRFNLREFIFENAAFNLLDFSVKGGQFSLRPAFPVKSDQTINYDATTDPNGGIDIRALFSDGNMRNLQVSFLTPEEREVFKATILFRKDEIESNGFPEIEVRTYAYKNNNQTVEQMRDLPEEVFDLSNWCTSEDQAHLFAAVALATRKEVDHGISFETTPTSVLGLLAGDYIRVISEVTHTSRFTNGSIDQDGFVTCRDNFNGSINIYYWTPGNLGGVQTGSLQVGSDGKATNGLRNVLFARVDTTEEDRLYKVESISYGEDGFIKVAASHQPLTSDNKLAILHRANPRTGNLNEFFPNILL